MDSRAEQLTQISLNVDSLLLLVSTPLIFWMQAGFTLLEAGSVRAKNTVNILLKNLIDVCIVTPLWFLIGYGLAFGDGNSIIGTSSFAVTNTDEYVFWLFQWAFCSTSVTIISGATAERIQFQSFMLIALLMSIFVYPPICHWVWSSQGFLHKWGMVDFAGSGVVHMTGGFTALVAANFLKPRVGRFGVRPREFPGHSITLATLGVWTLWFGWFAFNCGSALRLSGGSWRLSSHSAINTMLAPASAAVCSFAYFRLSEQTFHLTKILNSILAGLAAITASAGIVETSVAIFIGFWAGIIYQKASTTVEKFKIDDPLDAFAVHGACGLWGVIAGGLFVDKELLTLYKQEVPDSWGILKSGGGKFFGAQLAGCAFIIAWVMIVSVPFFYILRKYGLLRVSLETESSGLDRKIHSESAYAPLEEKISTWIGQRVTDSSML